MQGTQAPRAKKVAAGCSKHVPIVVALIALLGTVMSALIQSLPAVEFSRLRGPACGMDFVGDSQWTVLSGHWDYYGGLARFTTSNLAGGLLIGGKEFSEGSIETVIRMPGYRKGCKAHIAYSFHASSEDFLTAGLGGTDAAYSMGEYRAGTGWRQLIKKGTAEGLSEDQIYKIRLSLSESRAVLKVNDTKVAERELERGTQPSVAGIWVEGCEVAEFICTKVCPE